MTDFADYDAIFKIGHVSYIFPPFYSIKFGSTNLFQAELRSHPVVLVSFAALPSDISKLIVDQLDVKDLISLRLVSRSTKQFVDQCISGVNGAYWRRVRQIYLAAKDRSSPALAALRIRFFNNAVQMWPSLQTLDLSGQNLGDEGVKTLTRCSWPLLVSLNLKQNGCGSATAAVLAQVGTTSWPLLQKLYLNRNKLEDSIETLFNTQWSLVELDLGSNGITAAGLATLPETAHRWASLEFLSFANNPGIGDTGTKNLANAGIHWHALREMNLKGVGMGDSGLEALTASMQHWPHLHTLELGSVGRREVDYISGDDWQEMVRNSRNEFSAISGRRLGEAIKEHCPRVKKLGLYKTKIGSHGAAELASFVSKVDEIDLGGCNLGENRVILMAAAPLWGYTSTAPLRILNLQENLLTDAGVLFILGSPKFGACLQELNLSHNGLGLGATRALAMLGPRLRALRKRVLNLSHNPIEDRDLFMLLYHPWTNLRELDLSATNFSCSAPRLVNRLKTFDWSSMQKLSLAHNRLGILWVRIFKLYKMHFLGIS